MCYALIISISNNMLCKDSEIMICCKIFENSFLEASFGLYGLADICIIRIISLTLTDCIK